MATLPLKKTGETPTAAALRGTEWDPFRSMRELLRWDPLSQALPLPRALEPSFAPAFEVKETKDAYVFKADVPGVKEADLEISLTGNRLTVSGKRDSETEAKEDAYYTYERTYGAFTRTFTLPEGIDPEHVQAELKEGVLSLLIPKKPEMQARRISVKSEKMKA